MPKRYTAQCDCGAVKFEFDTDSTVIAKCRCNDCKKASGGEVATFFAVHEDDFILISGSPRAFHHTTNSGKGLDRNFCPECGAWVFTSNLKGIPQTVFVQLGSLDRPELIAPRLEMFAKRYLKLAEPPAVPQLPAIPT